MNWSPSNYHPPSFFYDSIVSAHTVRDRGLYCNLLFLQAEATRLFQASLLLDLCGAGVLDAMKMSNVKLCCRCEMKLVDEGDNLYAGDGGIWCWLILLDL